ncbi:hypothetical protein SAY86_000006 [Trapa natans]|uniref:Uncharacterized protein n=1 Tax=Trapa natans TaxID=22666 RepID=A0AAN7N0K2_TRANT|nr:hypothetical protein SAY86_000006 [Trapa natans]
MRGLLRGRKFGQNVLRPQLLPEVPNFPNSQVLGQWWGSDQLKVDGKDEVKGLGYK